MINIQIFLYTYHTRKYEKNNIINCDFDDECKLSGFYVYQGTGTTREKMCTYYRWWYTMFL